MEASKPDTLHQTTTPVSPHHEQKVCVITAMWSRPVPATDGSRLNAIRSIHIWSGRPPSYPGGPYPGGGAGNPNSTLGLAVSSVAMYEGVPLEAVHQDKGTICLSLG